MKVKQAQAPRDGSHRLIPDFDDGVAAQAEPCTPRSLYRALLDPEVNVHYFKPAFELAAAALTRAEPPRSTADEPARFLEELLAWARADLDLLPMPQGGYASGWPARVAVELGAVGLTDGAWLHGSVRMNVVESESGMALLNQLMIRFGDPRAGESYPQRYASLLRSIGVLPGVIARWERDEAVPCCDISYERALLGLALGLFPSSLRLETIGFNLWMAAVGPAPLLERLAEPLRHRGACLRYLERHDRAAMTALAERAAHCALDVADGPQERDRVARGFAAAHRSYGRWHQAMFGRNIPMRPREFVLEMVRRKAQFAIGNHGGVQLGGRTIDELLRGGEQDHEALLDRLAASPLVRPGDPAASLFLSRSTSIDGPMFEVFTASERRHLEEWIRSLTAAERAAIPREPPLALAGEYTPPQDLESLERHAIARWGVLDHDDLYFYLANADRYPSVRLFAKQFVQFSIDHLTMALDREPRLNSSAPPRYSERTVADMVAENYRLNVLARASGRGASDDSVKAEEPEQRPLIGTVFDGAWLQGFADILRAELEEYGWLFRIYAGELGDGKLTWNHNWIARHQVEGVVSQAWVAATEPELYRGFEVNLQALLVLAASLHTRHFLPELLGANLATEAAGVGGMYIDLWQAAAKAGDSWGVLNGRLHNGIDNYADGHTRWSIAAVQAYMARVRDSVPSAVEAQWQRIWRLWRFNYFALHGSPDERQALTDVLGIPPATLAPTLLLP